MGNPLSTDDSCTAAELAAIGTAVDACLIDLQHAQGCLLAGNPVPELITGSLGDDDDVRVAHTSIASYRNERTASPDHLQRKVAYACSELRSMVARAVYDDFLLAARHWQSITLPHDWYMTGDVDALIRPIDRLICDGQWAVMHDDGRMRPLPGFTLLLAPQVYMRLATHWPQWANATLLDILRQSNLLYSHGGTLIIAPCYQLHTTGAVLYLNNPDFIQLQATAIRRTSMYTLADGGLCMIDVGLRMRVMQPLRHGAVRHLVTMPEPSTS